MRYYVYILQSQSTDRYYCGHTNDLLHRLKQHNDPDYRSSRTTKIIKGPWEIVWSLECVTRAKAMKQEKAIKKRGINRYLKTAHLAESR